MTRDAQIPRAIDVVIGVGKRSHALLDGAREAGFPDAATEPLRQRAAGGRVPEERKIREKATWCSSKALTWRGPGQAVAMLEGA